MSAACGNVLEMAVPLSAAHFQTIHLLPIIRDNGAKVMMGRWVSVGCQASTPRQISFAGSKRHGGTCCAGAQRIRRNADYGIISTGLPGRQEAYMSFYAYQMKRLTEILVVRSRAVL
jgi:hypothetical protein